jgi:rhomboid protease GluP
MSGEPRYFITVDGTERGPYTLAVLRDVSKKGLLTPDTLCRADGSTAKVRAADLLGAPAPQLAAETALFAVKFQLGTSYTTFGTAATNPFRFLGKGSAQVRNGTLLLEGKRTRPFWFSKKMQVAVPLQDIRDVRHKDKTVAFDLPGKRGLPVTTTLVFAEPGPAASLAAALPRTVSQDAVELAEFEAKLAAKAKWAPVAIAMLVLNLLVFAAFGYLGGGFDKADSEMLIRWGSNFGPLTTDGQWWRLLSSAFLHGGIVHIAVNMYTLYDIGRLSERLFGSAAFLTLYVLSALLGSAASVWWNPSVNSVGASGALFGVLGATLVYMLDKRNGVPPSVMTTHAISIAVFVIYGVFNGLAKTGIDNAAHLGGLAGGVIAGFALARPIGAGPAPSLARRAAGVALCAAAILGLAFLTPNSRGGYETEQRFIADLKWLGDQETSLNASANDVFAKAKAGAADAELVPRVKTIVTGWSGAHARLSAYKIEPSSRLATLHGDIVAYTGARSRAFTAMARVFDDPQESTAHMQEYARLMKEGDAAVARINSRNDKKKS